MKLLDVRALTLVLFSLSIACGPKPMPSVDTALTLEGSDGRAHVLSEELARRDITVLMFYSTWCPSVKAHRARVAELVRRYEPRGVKIYWVHSNDGAEPARDAQLAKEQPIPLLTDADGKLARKLGVEYATHSVILDRHGDVRYSGAFDSDKHHMRTDATPHLANAIDDVLAGRQPARGPEPLGCPLDLDR